MKFFAALGMAALFAGIYFVGKIIYMFIKKEPGKKRWAKFAAAAFTAFVVFPIFGALTNPDKQSQMSSQEIKEDELLADQTIAEELALAEQKAAAEQALAEQRKLEQEKLLAEQKAAAEQALAEQQKLEQEKLLAEQKAAAEQALAEQEVAQDDSGGFFDSIKNALHGAKNSVSEKFGIAKESVNDKVETWREEREQRIAAENLPPDYEENKDAVKKYLENVQPFIELSARKDLCHVKTPLAATDADGLWAYSIQVPSIVESADFYFDSQQDERMAKVHAACRNYLLAEAKIASGYYNLKTGTDSVIDAAFAIKTLTNAKEYKDAYVQQAKSKKELERFAEWSGAKITTFSLLKDQAGKLTEKIFND